ncbi:DUF2000 domain-containing protein [Lacrimispora sp. 210928-DFI.3.58]|uniref:DUF2000 domain-containing protein n=1 Tax=Lacrimispora sp. 210928-DFI.3.58 TaxID=2883214 RepID=UPI001D082280|nr:DUF2000 domain-containing protein [Lacrimispora sp. 210928-DFI.3.58]MCB7317356.1 DUF2000 domain-containing protein [Lacrimispora sp. 210928-DFI.3.58]
MDLQNEKCVMIIDGHLPLGIIANTAAIMGITLGKKMPEVVGADVTDKTGNEHLGIIEFPVPILKGNLESIKAIREKLYEPDFSDLTVVDFSDLAQGCKTYNEFIEKMKFPAAFYRESGPIIADCFTGLVLLSPAPHGIKDRF